MKDESKKDAALIALTNDELAVTRGGYWCSNDYFVTDDGETIFITNPDAVNGE